MEILQTEHKYIRILAYRELKQTFGIDLKLNKMKSKNASPKKKCLGVPLENLEMVNVTAGTSTIQIPKVFKILIEFIKIDLKQEGIFRKEGSKSRERNIMDSLNSGDMQLPDNTSIIDAASVTKTILRNIPGQLITKDICPWFYAAGKLEPSKMEEALELCILLLPLRNIHLLVYLMEFFNEITKQSGSNKMTSYNLAVVIAPNIFPKVEDKDLQVQVEMSNLTLNITKSLIENCKVLQTVPSSLISKLEALEEELKTTRSKLCRFI